jgi:hypothetical protein
LRRILLAAVVLAQAVALFMAGLATLWWSQDLMSWLIWMVGEEYALGPASVIHLEGGGKLLTNPSAMVRWMLPFWFLGFIQITGAVSLIWLLGKARGRKEDNQ